MCGMIGLFYTMFVMTTGGKIVPRKLEAEVNSKAQILNSNL